MENLNQEDEITWGELYDHREVLSADVEEFYNQCHDKQGHFCEGADGPGRVRDKDISILPKNAPEYMKNLLRRRIATKQASNANKATVSQTQTDQHAKVAPSAKVVANAPKLNPAPKVATTDKGFTAPAPKNAPTDKGFTAKTPAAKTDKGFSAKPELKSEVSGHHPIGDYAYTPSATHSSEWKLRLTSKPGAKPDAKTVGSAVAALGKGFRGHKVEIPAADRPKVIAKVRAAWFTAHPGKKAADLPLILQKQAA